MNRSSAERYADTHFSPGEKYVLSFKDIQELLEDYERFLSRAQALAAPAARPAQYIELARMVLSVDGRLLIKAGERTWAPKVHQHGMANLLVISGDWPDDPRHLAREIAQLEIPGKLAFRSRHGWGRIAVEPGSYVAEVVSYETPSRGSDIVLRLTRQAQTLTTSRLIIHKP